MMVRNRLYPALSPMASGHLEVDPPHRIYWEESGNPDGVPVCFLHGGPGAGTTSAHRQFFDPQFYRIILYDQRGAGRSTPRAAVVANDTAALIADMERLRRHLSIEKWLLFGGSWGSSLALAYGEAHPERALGLILRGVFLARQSDVDWFLGGMGRFFPEAYRGFMEFLAEPERRDPLVAYYRILCDPDPERHLPAALAWGCYEMKCSSLLPKRDSLGDTLNKMAALALARLETHYFINRFFMEEGQLLANLDRVRHLPCAIIQGRYDMICPPAAALCLARAWPEADCTIVPDGGHSASEPGITAALVGTTDRFRKLLD